MYFKVRVIATFLFVISIFIYAFYNVQAADNTKILKKRIDKGRLAATLNVVDVHTRKQRSWDVYIGGNAQDLIDHRDVYRNIHEPLFIQRVSALDAIVTYMGEVPNQFGSSFIVQKDNK